MVLEGSFSAVSKPIFAVKGSCCSIFSGDAIEMLSFSSSTRLARFRTAPFGFQQFHRSKLTICSFSYLLTNFQGIFGFCEISLKLIQIIRISATFTGKLIMDFRYKKKNRGSLLELPEIRDNCRKSTYLKGPCILHNISRGIEN